MYKRKEEPTRTVTTLENVDQVRQSMLHAPKHSARKYAVALGMSGHSFHRILQDELHLHPCKMIFVQQLTERDYVTPQTSCEQLVDTLPNDARVFLR